MNPTSRSKQKFDLELFLSRRFMSIGLIAALALGALCIYAALDSKPF